MITHSNIQLLTDAIVTAAHASKSNEVPAPHVIHTGIVALRIFEHALRQYFCEYKNGSISEYPKVVSFEVTIQPLIIIIELRKRPRAD